MQTNGSYVTQREFARLEGTVNEMHGDLKTVVAYINREQGAADERSRTRNRVFQNKSLRISIMAVFFSGLWWVQDAIAKLMTTSPHHP